MVQKFRMALSLIVDNVMEDLFINLMLWLCPPPIFWKPRGASKISDNVQG
jgi:hypothetical protein